MKEVAGSMAHTAYLRAWRTRLVVMWHLEDDHRDVAQTEVMELEVARLQAGAAQHGKAWLQQEMAAKAQPQLRALARRLDVDQGRPSCRCRGEAVPTGQDRNLESFAGVCFAVLIVARRAACAEQLAQSNLQSNFRSVTRAEQLAWSTLRNLRRASCTKHLCRATCAQGTCPSSCCVHMCVHACARLHFSVALCVCVCACVCVCVCVCASCGSVRACVNEERTVILVFFVWQIMLFFLANGCGCEDRC